MLVSWFHLQFSGPHPQRLIEQIMEGLQIYISNKTGVKLNVLVPVTCIENGWIKYYLEKDIKWIFFCNFLQPITSVLPSCLANKNLPRRKRTVDSSIRSRLLTQCQWGSLVRSFTSHTIRFFANVTFCTLSKFQIYYYWFSSLFFSVQFS